MHRHDRGQHQYLITGTAHGQQRRSRHYSYRLRLNIRRAILRHGVRQIPPGKPRSNDRLLHGGQRRGHRRLQREADRFRCLRRAHDCRRAGRRPRRRFVQVPVDLGAEAIAYNLTGLPGLHLTGPVIARIFLGQITSWRDPAIMALNPHVSLPSQQITVVHRSDGSGITYIFSNYLSSVDPAWAAKVGTGTTLHWPGHRGGGQPWRRGSRRPHPVLHRLPRTVLLQGPALFDAAIRNQAGNYVTPTAASIAADAAQKSDITPTDFSIVNEPGAGSYPISGYSWALIYTHQASQATGQALVNLLDWLTHSGQAYAAATGYVPLPPQIQQLARSMLQQVTGPDGTRLLG